MTTITARFAFERETKGALRFQETDISGTVLGFKEAAIGILYVRKSALNGVTPQALVISIET